MISRKDTKFFNQAAMVAVAGQSRVRVGVVLAQGRRPYYWGHNVAGPIEGEPFHQGHAEIRALVKVRPKSTLYVARIDRARQLVPSRPCGFCSDQIEHQGDIRRVVFFDGTQLREVKV